MLLFNRIIFFDKGIVTFLKRQLKERAQFWGEFQGTGVCLLIFLCIMTTVITTDKNAESA